jgi:hypothetical protein
VLPSSDHAFAGLRAGRRLDGLETLDLDENAA